MDYNVYIRYGHQSSATLFFFHTRTVETAMERDAAISKRDGASGRKSLSAQKCKELETSLFALLVEFHEHEITRSR